MSEREPSGIACESCGKDLSEHLGLVGTCRQLEMYQKLYGHALECVDIVFQDEGKRKALLSDFLQLGDDKFDGVVKLAHAYLQSQLQLTAAQQRVVELGIALREVSSAVGAGMGDGETVSNPDALAKAILEQVDTHIRISREQAETKPSSE